MEQVKDYGTFDVLRRFVRRRWRTPMRVAALGMGALVISGSSFLIPRPKQDSNLKYVAAPGAEASGVVESLRQKGVGAAFDGLVKAVNVAPGQPVKKGQVLFQLDTSGQQMALQTARADAKSARSAYRQALSQRAAELRGVEQEIAALQSERKRAAQPLEQPVEEYTLTESGELQPVGPAVQMVDTSGLEVRLRELRAFRAERMQAWEPSLQAAREAIASADGEVKRLSSEIAAATRRAPMAGVVTAVRVRAGEWTTSHSPVVRIDDPQSYRVVTMVDEAARQTLSPGQKLQLAAADQRLAGKVEKLEEGWDRDLFYYYVWVKPAAAKGLEPGEKVEVQLPTTLVASK